MPFCKSWAALGLVYVAVAHSCLATAGISGPATEVAPASKIRFWKTFESDSKFIPVAHSSSLSTCEVSVAPEPLATPAPLMDASAAGSTLSVSFIIGTDGLVHSALLLKSVGDRSDRAILNVVRSWRYRPAVCNGVPIETEATVDFSSHQGSFGLK